MRYTRRATDRSNAFNTVNKTAVLAEVATCVPVLMPFVAKRYGERPADAFVRWTRGSTEQSLVERRAARGPYGTGDGFVIVAAGAEEFPGGVRGRRSVGFGHAYDGLT